MLGHAGWQQEVDASMCELLLLLLLLLPYCLTECETRSLKFQIRGVPPYYVTVNKPLNAEILSNLFISLDIFLGEFPILENTFGL